MQRTITLTTDNIVELKDAFDDVTEAYNEYRIAVNRKREMVHRFHEKGTSFREMADALGVSRSTIKQINRERITIFENSERTQ